jgi:uncharacterized damage-inducible protein DinB
MTSVTPPTSDICRSHLNYMIWADDLMLAAVRAKLPQRTEILMHIFMAERIWLARLEGDVSPAHLEQPAPADLPAVWSELHRNWLAWADAQSDWTKSITYKNMAGAEFTSALWQIALHVANHGSYHRGQVAAMIRAEGLTPPSTDLIVWYRSL